MPQEDRLKKEIDLMGRILGKILADLLGLKTEDINPDEIRVMHEEFFSLIDPNLQSLLNSEPKDLIIALKEKGFTSAHLDQLSEILFHLASQETDVPTRQNLLRKALVLLEHLENTETTYSLERHFRLERLRKELQ